VSRPNSRRIGDPSQRWRQASSVSIDPASVDSRTADALLYGWGSSYAAPFEYIQYYLRTLAETEGLVLECGSGLSTLVAGVVAQRRGFQVWAFEQSPFWYERVQAELDRFRIRAVRLCLTPLRDYGAYVWYDPPVELPPAFSAVACDGPPGETKGGRYGLWPVMRRRLASGCVVLLEDVVREDERRILKCWAEESGRDFSIAGTRRSFGVLRLP
jgi:hypothetical protein